MGAGELVIITAAENVVLGMGVALEQEQDGLEGRR
jgi:hypothetical protein